MSLHEAIGAMVGGGVGARRLGLSRDDDASWVVVIAGVLNEDPADLKAALLDQLKPGVIRDEAIQGATVGVSGIPLWDRLLCSHLGPFGDRELVQIAVMASLRRPSVDDSGWPAAESLVPYYVQEGDPPGFHVALPQDPGVIVGDVAALGAVEADAVVSLCRMGGREQLSGALHLEAWLIDSEDPAANPNLTFVLRDLAATIRRLRDGGKRVFVHCVRAESRTPAVAAAYIATRLGLSAGEALSITEALIPGPGPGLRFREALDELYPSLRIAVKAPTAEEIRLQPTSHASVWFMTPSDEIRITNDPRERATSQEGTPGGVTFYRWVDGPDGHRERLGEVRLIDGVLNIDPGLENRIQFPRFDRGTGRGLAPSDGAVWFEALIEGRIWRPWTSSAYGALWAEPNRPEVENGGQEADAEL